MSWPVAAEGWSSCATLAEAAAGARRGWGWAPHEAASQAKQPTGNCPCDLLLFKALAPQLCLLVQSLIIHLRALRPCTAGKAKHCQDGMEMSQAAAELGTACWSLLPPAGAHSSTAPRVLCTPPAQAQTPQLQSIKTRMPTECAATRCHAKKRHWELTEVV